MALRPLAVTFSLAVSVKMTVVRPFLETAKGLSAIINTDLSIKGENPHTLGQACLF